jgi:cGMP-dependent 3',5'-cyclic phosphodiesterase
MGLRPNKMMDRQKACIPALQIEFLTTVIRPTFEILVRLFPECEQFLDIIDTNRRHWDERKQQDINEQEGREQLVFVERDEEESVEDID